MNMMWCTHTIEHYSFKKSNKLLKHATMFTKMNEILTWMSSVSIIVSERSQPKDYISYDSIYMTCSE